MGENRHNKMSHEFAPHRRHALARLTALSTIPFLPDLAFADASVLNALPRVALVVGNSAYRDLPQLRNPANDAKVFGGRLKDLGFKVTEQIDIPRATLEESIKAFCAKIGGNVGLFYFAGHGLQVGWHNYLIPTDAKFASVDDVPKKALDLITLIDGLRAAKNPMNIVILDACRDNPFATEFKTGKGLSQMDAPVGTFLAYATAPGNTASDGEGSNGLYTEYLLKEMPSKDAKIEDVFKRVRLNVRRASNGQQIPWESTSLEDDFYFVPPPQIKTASKEELDRRYSEELALWEKVDAKVSTIESPKAEK